MNKGRAFDKFFNNMNFSDGKPGVGKILISEPFLTDPNFSHTVVLLTSYNPKEGSFGFILNNPSEYGINDVVDGFPTFQAKVFIGGPVGMDNLFFIHTLGDKVSGSQYIYENLYWGGDFEELKNLVKEGDVSTDDIIFFVGYSGWDADQLKNEIKEDSWIIAELSSDEVMKKSGKKLWNEVLKKLGKGFKIMSNFPTDPSLN